MSAQHTPGPWVLDHNHHVYAGGEPVYRNYKDDKGVDHPHRLGLIALPYSSGGGSHEANARLIAAAPELLEALEQAVTSMQDSGYPNSSVAVRAARQAIAKAKGTP